MLRIRAEADPAAWRPVRWAFYLMAADVFPIVVAGAIWVGGGFGEALLLATAMSVGMVAFGVEFTVFMGRKPQAYEFDEAGVRVILAGQPQRTFRWSELSSVRVRTGGPRTSPALAFLQFRSGLRMFALSVDLIHYRDMGERVAAFLARYAPQLRKGGNTGIFSWDPARAADGDLVVRVLSMEPMGYAAVGLIGPAFGAWLIASGALIGMGQDPYIFTPMAAAYIVLGIAQIAYAEWAARSVERDRPPAFHDGRVRALLAVAVLMLGLESALGILLPRW